MTTGRLMRELQRQLGQTAPARRPAPAEPRPRPRSPRPPTHAAPGEGGVARSAALPVSDPADLERLKAATPAKVGVGRAGLRYRTETLLQFLTDFSIAQAAVESQVPEGWAEQQGWLALQTEATDPEQFLARPDLGRRLPAAALETLRSRCQQNPDVQIVVGDGLSAEAVMQNAPQMVQTLTEELQSRGVTVGSTLFVRHCRAKISDVVGQAVGARVGAILVGERPGLGTGDGMSAYLVWAPHPDRTDAEKQAISNVHRRGLLPAEAGLHAANVIQAILQQQTSGVNLDLTGVELPESDRTRINQANPDAELGCGQSHGQQCDSSRDGLPGTTCDRTDDRPCETHRD